MHKIAKRLVANAAVLGVVTGAILWGTPASASTTPTVQNAAATNVTDNSATANCTVNPGDNDVLVWVVYKLNSATWSAGPVYKGYQVKSSGASTVNVELEVPVVDPDDGVVGDLLPATQYNYRCKVRKFSDPDSGTITDSNTVSFTTGADALAITNDSSAPLALNDEEGEPYPSDTQHPVRTDAYAVTCLVNPKGGDTKVWPVWKESTATWSTGPVYGGKTTDQFQSIPAESTRTQHATFVLDGLGAGLTYDFRCKADLSGQSPITDTNTQQFTVPSSSNGLMAARSGFVASTSTASASYSSISTYVACRTWSWINGYEYFRSYVAWTPEWRDRSYRWHAGIARSQWAADPSNSFSPASGPYGTWGRYFDLNLLSYNNTGSEYWKIGNDNMHGTNVQGDTWYLYKGEWDSYAPADPLATGMARAKHIVRMGWANDNISSCNATHWQPTPYAYVH